MSQEKAQLIAPIENITVTGVVATGVITATSFDGNVTGSASSIVQGANVVAGIVTAGLNTTTAFSGNLTGNAGGLSGDPDIHVGVLTATSFVGNVTGIVTGRATGLSNTGAGTSNLNIGTFTATTFHGDGSSLSGVAGAAFSQQSIGITSATTTIDLSNGNVINVNQSASTTVSFANTAGTNEVYIFRDKDATTTVRTITWPASIKWDGGTEPTLTNVSDATTEVQIFKLNTTTNGEAWYGKEVYNDKGSYALFAVGRNYQGFMGNNASASSYYSSPVLIGGGNPWTGMVHNSYWGSAGFGYKNDGSLWTTGGISVSGLLGLNAPQPTALSSPVQIGTDTNWAEGGTLSNNTMYTLKTNGELWVWGANNNGRLGLNQGPASLDSLSSPTQIPGTTWSTIGASERTIFATKTNGTMWVWGINEWGQVGKNDTNDGYSSPTQLGAGNDWAFGCGSNYSIYASKTDNSLWVWGRGHYGMLGLNASGGGYGFSSPVELPGTNWGNTRTTMSCGNHTLMANIKTDGTLWSWGYGGYGSLGKNDTVQYSSPIQVGSEDTWASISACGDGAFATKTDGTGWTWGANGTGQLGQNGFGPSGYLSSPTQLPGSWRPDVGGNYYGVHLLKNAW